MSTAVEPPPSGARRIVGNTILLSAGQGVGIVSMAVWTVAVARRIGPETYGFYSFAQAVVSILVIFVTMGLDEVTTRDVARNPGRGRAYLATIARVKAVTALLVLGGFLVVWSQGDAGSTEMSIVSIVAVMGGIQSLNSLMMALLQAREAMHLFVAGQVTNYVLTMTTGVIAIWLDRSFVTVLALSMGASLVQLAVTLTFVRRRVPPPETAQDSFPAPRDFPRLVRRSIPFAALAIITVLHTNMLIILLRVASYSDESLGHFAAAQRLSSLVLIVPSMVSQVLVPAFSRTFARDPSQFKGMFERAYRYALFVSLPAAVVIAAVSPAVLTLVYGDEFAPAGATLRVLALVLAGAAGYVLVPAFVAMDRQNLVARIQAANLVIGGALAFVLISLLGAEGAAWALVVSAVGSMAFYSRLAFPMLDLRYPGAWTTKTVVSTAATAAVCFGLAGNVHFVLVALAGPVVYLGVNLALRTLSATDWQYLRSIASPARTR